MAYDTLVETKARTCCTKATLPTFHEIGVLYHCTPALYLCANFILFHSKKLKPSKLLNLKIDGVYINQVFTVKYLGVTFDSNLTWKNHINELCSKLSKTVGIFSKLRYNVNIDILVMLYYSLIYPFLIYGVQVWGLTYPTYLKPVTTLQKRLGRILTFSEPMSHSEPLLKSLNLLKFNDIIHSEILFFVYQWFHKLVPSCFFLFFQADILYT